MLSIMCLYPRIIRNRRYTSYKLKQGDIKCTDSRKLFVAIGCGECIECRKQKSREWQVRLHEEIKCENKAYFLTLTFDNKHLKKLCEDKNDYDVNHVAKLAIRRFLERWRKKYKKSVKHWFVTELGHTNTERIHLHGILFTNEKIDDEILSKIWKYGNIYIGEYCNAKTINYIVKYITKIDPDHKDYKSIILCSSGLGSSYFKNPFNIAKHKFNGKETIQYYTLNDGSRINLPIYYRNHFWTQTERDKLWTYTLDKDRTYVRGIRIDNISSPIGYRNYMRILETQQKENKEMGYGNPDWKKDTYYVNFQMLNGKNYEKT